MCWCYVDWNDNVRGCRLKPETATHLPFPSFFRCAWNEITVDYSKRFEPFGRLKGIQVWAAFSVHRNFGPFGLIWNLIMNATRLKFSPPSCWNRINKRLCAIAINIHLSASGLRSANDKCAAGTIQFFSTFSVAYLVRFVTMYKLHIQCSYSWAWRAVQIVASQFKDRSVFQSSRPMHSASATVADMSHEFQECKQKHSITLTFAIHVGSDMRM